MSAIGIDLGTSNTVVAHFKNGGPHTLCDPAGRRLIPSIVSFHPSGTVLVGDSAKMRRFNDGVSTVTGAKRLMGRLWGSPELEEMKKRVPYQLREGKNRTVRALLRGELYSIPELSAFVLRKAKAWAEEALGETVKEAVITVPANFNELQRQATKLAGELAGLDVLRVLNEPTAAALAYGHFAPAARDEQIAVYDFGGGTFDLTMLRMSERELRVRATAGDMFLGGDDIDLKIATRIAEAYLAKHFYDPRVDTEIFTRIRVAAERLKVDLSADAEATAPLNELMYGPGGKPIQWSYTMKRKELEAVLDPFINQSLKVCQDAMDLLKASPKDFDRVVLVGGTTLSPRVRQRVAEFFGREPVEGLDPEEAVALGAAISSTMPIARRGKAGAVAVAASANARALSAATAGAGVAKTAAAGARPAASVPLETLDDSDLILDEGETAEGYPVRQSFGPGPGEPAADVLLRPPPAMMSGAPAAPRGASRPPSPVRRRGYVWYGLGVAVVLGTVAVLAVRAEAPIFTPSPPLPSASAAPIPSASAAPAAVAPSAIAVPSASAAPSAAP